MYNIPYFKAVNQEEVLAFMRAHPFILLCGITENGFPVASHIPVLLDEREGKLFLLGHVMIDQQHTQAFLKNPNVLAVFSGANTYVSASWYENKQVASTWNYQAVHATGVLHFFDDAGLHDLLSKLTRHFEGSDHSPSLVNHLPGDYVHRLMKEIVAFEMEVTDIQHVFKLSQNHTDKNQQHIIENLKKGDVNSQVVASVMETRKKGS